jgi:hypothetical protein
MQPTMVLLWSGSATTDYWFPPYRQHVDRETQENYHICQLEEIGTLFFALRGDAAMSPSFTLSREGQGKGPAAAPKVR